MKRKIIYDYSKLRGIIIEKCETQLAFSALVGLSDRSITFKMNNQRDWTQSDIEKAIEILDISRENIPKYFYTPLHNISEPTVVNAD